MKLTSPCAPRAPVVLNPLVPVSELAGGPHPRLRSNARPDCIAQLDHPEAGTVGRQPTVLQSAYPSYADIDVGQYVYRTHATRPFEDVHTSLPGTVRTQVFVSPMDKVTVEYHRDNLLLHNNHMPCSRQFKDEQGFRESMVNARVTSLNRR